MREIVAATPLGRAELVAGRGGLDRTVAFAALVDAPGLDDASPGALVLAKGAGAARRHRRLLGGGAARRRRRRRARGRSAGTTSSSVHRRGARAGRRGRPADPDPAAAQPPARDRRRRRGGRARPPLPGAAPRRRRAARAQRHPARGLRPRRARGARVRAARQPAGAARRARPAHRREPPRRRRRPARRCPSSTPAPASWRSTDDRVLAARRGRRGGPGRHARAAAPAALRALRRDGARPRGVARGGGAAARRAAAAGRGAAARRPAARRARRARAGRGPGGAGARARHRPRRAARRRHRRRGRARRGAGARRPRPPGRARGGGAGCWWRRSSAALGAAALVGRDGDCGRGARARPTAVGDLRDAAGGRRGGARRTPSRASCWPPAGGGPRCSASTRRSLGEARRARALGAALRAGGAHGYDDVAVYDALLGEGAPPAARELAEHTLGPLYAGAAAHAGDPPAGRPVRRAARPRRCSCTRTPCATAWGRSSGRRAGGWTCWRTACVLEIGVVAARLGRVRLRTLAGRRGARRGLALRRRGRGPAPTTGCPAATRAGAVVCSRRRRRDGARVVERHARRPRRAGGRGRRLRHACRRGSTVVGQSALHGARRGRVARLPAAAGRRRARRRRPLRRLRARPRRAREGAAGPRRARRRRAARARCWSTSRTPTSCRRGYPTSPEDELRVTIAHELFHAIQFGMGAHRAAAVDPGGHGRVVRGPRAARDPRQHRLPRQAT